MKNKQLIDRVMDKRDEILGLGLSIIFFIVCVIHVLFIVVGHHIEQMWMVFGTLAMMLLLINSPKNILTIFVIIIFGTFVADEEFLLEVAAITKGEQLSQIRESRNFEVLTVSSGKEKKSALTTKLEELLQGGKNPKEIIHALEEFRIDLEVEEDLPGFDPVDKDVVLTFASRGTLDESVFFQIMQNKGYTVNEVADAFEKLGAAEYLANNPDNVDEAHLTMLGVALAKALGVREIMPVSY